jgi:hypothetical protein
MCQKIKRLVVIEEVLADIQVIEIKPVSILSPEAGKEIKK